MKTIVLQTVSKEFSASHFAAICVLMTVLLTLSGCWQTVETTTLDEASARSINVNVQIEGPDSKSKTSALIKEGETVLTALSESGVQFEYSGTGSTAFVKSIDGIANDKENGNYWFYFVNDELAKVGCGSWKLKPDDQVKWVYGKSPFDIEKSGSREKDN